MTRTLYTLLIAVLVAVGLAPDARAQTNGQDNRELLALYSLYYEAYKAEDWETSWYSLEQLLEQAPAFTGREPDDRNIRRAVEVLTHLAEQTDDAAQKEAYYQQALELFDTAPSTLQDAGVEASEAEWIYRKGRYLQENAEALADLQDQVYALYTQAFELDPEVLSDYYLNFLAAERVRQAATGSPAEKVEARTFLDEQIVPRLDSQEAIDYVENTLKPSLISTPQEEFDYLVTKYEADSAADEEILRLYELRRFADDTLKRQLLDEVARLDPTPNVLRQIAVDLSQQGQHAEATERLEQALELAEEPNERRDILYSIAAVKEQQGQYASARNYANEALAIDANHAESLYLIGGLISRSVSSADARSRAGYWCAADQYNRAAAAARAAGNSQLASAAASAASSANRAAPTSEEYFFLGWQPGQSVTASYGWGSCTTTVR